MGKTQEIHIKLFAFFETAPLYFILPVKLQKFSLGKTIVCL